PAPAGEKSLLGGFEDLAQAAAKAEGGAKGKQELFQFLRQHPELEIPIKQYEKLLFESVTTGYKPGELTAEEMKQRMETVSMLGEFYKPDRARVFVDTPQQAQAFGEVVGLLRGLTAEGTVAVIAKQRVFDYLDQHPEVRDVVCRYGASSNDARVVAVLDE